MFPVKVFCGFIMGTSKVFKWKDFYVQTSGKTTGDTRLHQATRFLLAVVIDGGLGNISVYKRAVTGAANNNITCLGAEVLGGSVAATLVVFAIASLIATLILRRVFALPKGQVKTFDSDIND